MKFQIIEKDTPEETYEDFDYLLFNALMEIRDFLMDIIQEREIPMTLRLQKLLTAAHDFQLCYDKNELYKWETLLNRHLASDYGDKFLAKVDKKRNHEENSQSLITQMWKVLVPEMEVLRPGWREFLGERLLYLYSDGNDLYRQHVADFTAQNPDWEIQMEQLLMYWIYTYFCGAVYDGEIFTKVKLTVLSTLFIRDLAVGQFVEQEGHLSFNELVTICYRFSRELEHSDLNLNKMEALFSEDELFSLENLLSIC